MSALSPEDVELHAEKLKVWDVVLQAQTEAAKMFKPNNTAASVDIAARKVINDAGYEGTFTHRLGHGIGIKGTFALCCFCTSAEEMLMSHQLMNRLI